MRPVDDTNTDPGSGRGFFGPRGELHPDNSSGVTPRTTGLASSLPREEEPADAATSPAKAPRPVVLPFELAAVLRHHDPATTTGAEDARHDYRVWDLIDGGDDAA